MGIVLIGGHERMKKEYKVIGEKYGHKIKVFTDMSANFDKTIGTPELMILLTNTVSHKMIKTAVKEAKRKKIPVIRCHTSSGSSLKETLNQL